MRIASVVAAIAAAVTAPFGVSATVMQFHHDGTVAMLDADSARTLSNTDVTLAALSPDRARYRALSEAVALRHAGADAVTAVGLDAVGFARLFTALIDQESRFDPVAVSPKGAQGLGQLMPATAAALGVRDPFDPEANLDGAARYLTAQLGVFGDVTLALAAYNAGPERVIAHGGVPPFRETRDYIAAITRAAGLTADPAADPAAGPAALPTVSPAASPKTSPLRARDGAGHRSPSVWQF